MRTDSISLSIDSIDLIREKILDDHGDKYLPNEPIEYKTKKKNAQEAHEAIRPTDINIKPEDIKAYISEEQYKLYDLIWRRTISSQMTNAETNLKTISIKNAEESLILKATMGKLTFDGFKKIYNLQEEDEEQTFSLLDDININDEYFAKKSSN
jgi:DNA topoisomerase-1